MTTALEAETASCRADEALCRLPPTEDDTEPHLPGDKARVVGGDPRCISGVPGKFVGDSATKSVTVLLHPVK